MRKIISFLIGIIMLLTTFGCVPAVAQSASDDVTPSQATVTLREAFSADLKETAIKEDDGYIGIPVIFSAFRRESVPSKKNVVVYIVGHGEKRVGTDSDTDIVNDLLNEGYIVTVLDYLDNPKAVGDALAWSVQLIDAVDIDGTKKYVGGNAFNNHAVFPVPAGCRIKREIYYFSLDTMAPYGVNEYIVETYNMYYAGVKKDNNGEFLKPATTVYDCLKKDGTPINMDLGYDIVYPSNPTDTVPVFMMASSSETYYGSINSSVRPYFPKATLSGYAAVIYEHEYVPMSRDDHFGYLDARFTLSHYTANKVHSAAVRRVRYLADEFGYDADYISSYGFSKSGANAVLADVNHFEKGEFKTLDAYCPEGKSPEDTPEEQPWLYYEDTNIPISSDVTTLYTGAGTGLNQIRDWAITDNSVPLIGSIGTLDDTAGFRWQIPVVTGYLDTLKSETAFLEGVGIGHNPAYGYDEAKEIDNFTTIWTWLDNHVRAAYRKEAPKVLWMLPKAGTFFSEMDKPIEVKFSRAMDPESLKSGIKVIRMADNKVIDGEWVAQHGNTTFKFNSALIIPGSKYKVEVTDKCLAKDGVALEEEFTKTFAIAGDAFLTASENTTTDGNVNDGISVAPSDFGGYTSNVTFKRNGGYGDVVRASLILNRSNAQNTQLKVEGNDFSVLHPVDNSIEIIDVSDYVRNANGEEIRFALSSLSKSGKTLDYDFESGNINDFRNGAHYRLGGTGSPIIEVVNGGCNGNYCLAITKRNTDCRIKLLNSTGKTALKQSDLGSTLKVNFNVKTSKNSTMGLGMYVTSGQPYGAFSEVTQFVEANKWTNVTYNVSITQDMIDNNTVCFGISPLDDTDLYLDDILVQYDAGVTNFVSVEQAAASTDLLAPTLVLYTPVATDRELTDSAIVTSGALADTVLGNEEMYVDGIADSDISDTKKGYLKVPVDSLSVDANSYKLNFKVNTDGKSSVSVYGVLDDDSRFAENFDNTITWNNAFANDISGYAVETNKVYGGAALATVETAKTANFTVDVTSYVKYMKSKGYSNVTFIFVSNLNNETATENFNKLTEFSNYSADSSLKGFSHGIMEDPADPTNKVLGFEKSAAQSPVNGYYQRIYIGGYLGTNGKWTKADVGTKYTVSYRLYNKSSGATTGVYCFIYSGGGNDKNVPGTVRTVDSSNSNQWNNVTFTFTVTDEFVTNYPNCTSIIIGSGWAANATYIDDLKVVKEIGNTSIDLTEEKPYITDGTKTAQYSLVAGIDGAQPDAAVALNNVLPVSKTAVSGVQGITKAYYTFDKADVQRIDEAKLKIKVQSPENNKKLFVYGLNGAVDGDICWTTAYGNTATNKMNMSLVGGTFEISMTGESEYTVDVTDFISSLRQAEKISFAITAGDDLDKLVIKNVSLSISGSASDTAENSVKMTKPFTDIDDGEKIQISAETNHAVEKFVTDVKFYVDNEFYLGEVFKNGDTYHTYANLKNGEHNVYAVFNYTDGTTATTEPTVFKVISEEYKVGDVDGNGSVNAADLALLKKIIVGLESVDSEVVKNPDVDGSGGTPNAADLAQLKKMIAGLLEIDYENPDVWTDPVQF